MPKISEDQRAAARQRLIDATVAVAERDGIDGLTTRAIVAEAGVSAGMFYGHFDSKESLLAAVVDFKVDELTRIVAAEVELGASMEHVMRGLLAQLVSLLDLRALSAFRNATTSEESVVTNRRINARIVDAFAPIVTASIDAGVLRPDLDVEAVVEFIDILIDGLNRRRSIDGFVTDDARVVATILTAVERALLQSPAIPLDTNNGVPS